MGKAGSTKKTTSAEGDLQQALDTFNARQKFMVNAINMSWQLAVMVVVRVVAGIKLDQRFDSSASLTLSGFFLAAFAGCMVVWKTVQNVNSVQQEEDRKTLMRKLRRKKSRA